jgi:hypothetical protein
MLLITSYDKLAGYAAAEDGRGDEFHIPIWDSLHKCCQTRKKRC